MRKLLIILLFPLIANAQYHWTNGANNYVYIIAGQSNATGIATNPTSELITPYKVNGNAYIYDSTNWVALSALTNNNQQPPRAQNSGYAFEMALAQGLTNYTHGKVYFIKYAISGVPCCNAQTASFTPFSSTQLYSKSLTWVNNGLTNLTANGISYTVAGIIIYQGERDSGIDSCATNYKTNLKQWINRLRTDLSLPSLPAYIVRMPTWLDHTDMPYWNTVRTAQTNAASELSGVTLINVDDLTFDSDSTHLTGESQIVLGLRIAATDAPNLLIRSISK